MLNDINAKLPFYDMKVDEEIISESLLNSLINIKLLKSLYVPAFILLTIYHILVWLLASPLEKLLRWKLARAP